MKTETKITIAAQCDKAARDGINEDNCLVLSEVGRANPSVNHFGDVTAKDFSKMIPLRAKGCLLVVADGMGGMNAGEVASQIAVTTIAKYFSEDNMKNLEMTENAIKKFIRKAIISADEAIKKTASKDKEKEGMGTTVALLWLMENNTAYYAWCGDSRIYRYTPEKRLQTLSHDHSYVMEVLHLSEEEAFLHPNNNIITRSLGNPMEKANPDIEGPINVYQDDLFLLCSDGLCGVLPSDQIETVIEESIPDADHLVDGVDQLWTAAAAAGWHDNVTTLLCQVKTGPKRPEEKKSPALQTSKNTGEPVSTINEKAREKEEKRSQKIAFVTMSIVALVIIAVFGTFYIKNYSLRKENTDFPAKVQPQEQPSSPFDTTDRKIANYNSSAAPDLDKRCQNTPQKGSEANTASTIQHDNPSTSIATDVSKPSETPLVEKSIMKNRKQKNNADSISSKKTTQKTTNLLETGGNKTTAKKDNK